MFTLRNFLTFRIPGILKSFLGAVIFAIGAWLTEISYDAAAPGESFVIFKGLLVVGAVYFLFGLAVFAAFLFRTISRKLKYQNATQMKKEALAQTLYEKALLEGLLAILTSEKVFPIEAANDVIKIIKEKTSISISLDGFKKLAKKAKKKSKAISAYFFEIEPWITDHQKGLIIAESFIIATNPGADASRLKVFKSIIYGLGVSPDDTADSVKGDAGDLEKAKNPEKAPGKAAAARVPETKQTRKSKEGSMANRGLNPKLKVGLYAVVGLTVLFLIISLLVGGNGPGGPTSAQITRDNQIRSLELERDQHVFRKKQVENASQTLINKNPDIALALGAVGVGSSIAVDQSEGGWTRFFAGLAGLLGADYCLEYARACNLFIQEMSGLENERILLAARIETINQEVGFRLQIVNSCSSPIVMNVLFYDAENIEELSTSILQPGQTEVLKNRLDFYFRTKYPTVQFYGKTADGKLTWDGEQSFQIDGELVNMRTYKYNVRDNSIGEIKFTCG